MSGDSVEEIQAGVRKYLVVFAALAALTVITVAVSYLDVPTPVAIAIALGIAAVKASLVALYFMHLLDEVKVIYWILGLTLCFFLVLMIVPTGWFKAAWVLR